MGKKITDFLSINVFKGDVGIWMIYFLLCMVSLVEIYSAGSNLTFKSGNHWDPLVNQAFFLSVGFLVILLMNNIPCKYFKLIPVLGLPISAGLLVWLLVQQNVVNDASRWIDIFGVKFQPSELAKSMLIISVAVIMAKVNQRKLLPDTGANRETNRENMRRAFLHAGVRILIICGLILPENFSTAAMLFVVMFALMYIANTPFRYLLKTVLVIMTVGAVAVTIVLSTPEEALEDNGRVLTWKHRIEKKLHIHSDENDNTTISLASAKDANMDENWQENVSHIAIANSRFIGKGVGNSDERDFLPHAESDFIYSIIVEETGFIGGFIVMMLYVTLLIRAWRIARKCDKYFPAFLVVGLCLMLVTQALVNMAVAVGLAPVTGQTLPLISHGGTSILITSFNIGMILSVSRYAQKVEARQLQEKAALETADAEFGSSEGMD
ncbi:MAG: FtsW/RodA/SpoVE family cell cycle protein [Bacteroidaceae bacterium]|nr:FtsW/RodA/SpoVE family cell cycle protein [Bacteroidaceae bacterium]